MPIDPSIILGVKPQQFTAPDPMEQYGKVMTLRHLMQQGAISDRALADDDATRAAYQESGGDPATLRALLAGKGQYKAVQAFDKVQGEADLRKSTMSKNAAQEASARQTALNHAATGHRDQLNLVNDPQTAAQWVTAGFQDPDLARIWTRMGTPEDIIRQIPQESEAFQKWKRAMSLPAEKLVELSKPVIQTRNTGQTTDTLAVDPFTGKPTVTSSIQNTQSPDSVASIASAAAGRAQSERHFQANQNAPQYMDTDAGIVALPKRLGAGQAPVATPVVGPTGDPLGKPLKQIPASVNTAIVANSQSIKQLQTALDLLEGKKVGAQTGDKNGTGLKGYLPNAVLNRVDPEGTDVRAAIADIGSLKIHDRSGAAVTAAESPRLMPFIPLATDDGPTVKKKLQRMKEIAEQESLALGEAYSKDQGYRPSSILERTNASQPKRVNSLSEADPAQHKGQVATGDDGVKYKSDGSRWVRVP